MKREHCLVCGSSELVDIIDLGMHGFADTFVDKQRINSMLPVYNLSCRLCNHCKHVQTTTITQAEDRYNLFDYSYTSSNSSIATTHWKNYTIDISMALEINSVSRVCEIGSNDGYLLGLFKGLGCEILGIDASKHISEIANSNGIPTKQCIFNLEEAKQITKDHGRYNLVIANNVFNHSDDPLSFAAGANELLIDSGFFVFEVPYWKSTIDSKKIDQVYHEHVSYFTATSAKTLLENCGFQIIKLEIVDYHGGSLRVYAQKVGENEAIKHCDELNIFVANEEYLFKIKTYENLVRVLKNKKIKFLNKLLDYKERGYGIIAIGAAAKGNTLLNYLNLDDSIVDWVTDTSDFKLGKRTPLSNIEICDDGVIASYDKVCALILSWNLSETIKNKIKKINSNIKFINFYE